MTGVKLSDGEDLYADKVVVCMGPWSGKLKFPNNERIPVKGSHVHSIVLKPNCVIPAQAIFAAMLTNSTTAEPEVTIIIATATKKGTYLTLFLFYLGVPEISKSKKKIKKNRMRLTHNITL